MVPLDAATSSEAENETYDVSSSSGFPIHNRNTVTNDTGNRFTGSMIINLLQTSPSVYTQIGQFHRWSSLSDGTDVVARANRLVM